MTVTLTYEPTFAGIEIDANGLGAADLALIERSTNQISWTTVRGATAVPVAAGVMDTIVDYEFTPALVNYYRVRGRVSAAPSFVSAGAASSGSSGSRTPGLPAGLALGDMVYIFASTRNSGSVDEPANWDFVEQFVNVAILQREYDGVWSMPTITFTGGAANEDTIAQSAAFRNVETSPQGPAAVQLNGSAQNIAHPALTVANDDSVVIAAGWKQDDYTSVAALAGFTEIQEASSAAGNDASQIWDYQIQTDATAITAGSFTVTGGGSAVSRGIVFAVPKRAYLNEQTGTVVPEIDDVWLKSLARPFLNRPIQALLDNPFRVVRRARTGVFNIKGRTLPVAVNDIRGSRQFTVKALTETDSDTQTMDFVLAAGDVMLIQTPEPGRGGIPNAYVTIGDAEQSYHPLRPEQVTWSLPCVEVAPPGPHVVGALATWDSVLAQFADWDEVLATFSTWQDLLDSLIGDPSEVIVP